MESIYVVHFDDGGVIAFSSKKFEEFKQKGFEGVYHYEYWFDKKDAQKRYDWIT